MWAERNPNRLCSGVRGENPAFRQCSKKPPLGNGAGQGILDSLGHC